MTDIRRIEPGIYNVKLAEALKDVENFKTPSWISFVKSGPGKARPTIEPDFWHKRAASILRQLYIRKTVGVQRLRTRYGNKKKRGNEPSKFVRAGGKIIRLLLQQAEQSGFVEKVKGKRSGRALTEKGKAFLEEIARNNNDKTLSEKS